VANSPLRINRTLDDGDSDGQCDWDGTINHYRFETDSDLDFTCPANEASDTDSDGFSEFGDDELLQMALNSEAELLKKPTAYQEIMKNGASKLNFIKFFWGAVKRWLRENCDYTFKTL